MNHGHSQESPLKSLTRFRRYAFDYLDAPVTRVNSADVSLPYAPTLVEEFLPNPAKVIAAVKSVMYR